MGRSRREASQCTIPKEFEKTFHVVDGGNLVRHILKKLGWKDLSGKSKGRKVSISTLSPCNLLWASVSSTKILFSDCAQRPWQLLNHFPNSSEISNKLKLIENLRRYCWESKHGDGVCDICPETYNLTSNEEMKAFLIDFIFHRACAALSRSMPEADIQEKEGNGVDWDTSAQLVAILCILKRLAPHVSFSRLVPGSLKQHGFRLKATEVEAALAPNGAPLPCKSRRPARPAVTGTSARGSLRDASTAEVIAEGHRWMQILSEEGRDSSSMEAVGGAWLIKIPSLDRGEGVHVHGDLVPLLMDAQQHQWDVMVQRYIERPFLLSNSRKCDVRMWVLITSWTPAVCWVYPEPYLRVASQPFDQSVEKLADPFVHLTNRCVQKQAGDESDSHSGAPKDEDEETIWMLSHLFAWADDVGLKINCLPEQAPNAAGKALCSAKDAWANYTWPKMLQAVRIAVLACQHQVGSHPKGCFELLGFDFLLDGGMRPWLLEANASPDLCSDAGPTLRGLVKTKMGQLFHLVSGLHDGTVQFPDRYGALDEPIEGSGSWRLVLHESVSDSAAVKQPTPSMPCTGGDLRSKETVLQEWLGVTSEVAPQLEELLRPASKSGFTSCQSLNTRAYPEQNVEQAVSKQAKIRPSPWTVATTSERERSTTFAKALPTGASSQDAMLERTRASLEEEFSASALPGSVPELPASSQLVGSKMARSQTAGSHAPWFQAPENKAACSPSTSPDAALPLGTQSLPKINALGNHPSDRLVKGQKDATRREGAKLRWAGRSKIAC